VSAVFAHTAWSSHAKASPARGALPAVCSGGGLGIDVCFPGQRSDAPAAAAGGAADHADAPGGSGTRQVLANETIVLVPEGLGAVGLERVFLDAIPTTQRITIRHPLARDGESDKTAAKRLSGRFFQPPRASQQAARYNLR
jgi:hypothetical protein